MACKFRMPRSLVVRHEFSQLGFFLCRHARILLLSFINQRLWLEKFSIISIRTPQELFLVDSPLSVHLRNVPSRLVETTTHPSPLTPPKALIDDISPQCPSTIEMVVGGFSGRPDTSHTLRSSSSPPVTTTSLPAKERVVRDLWYLG